MADLTKDREETLKMAVDFSDALDTGDSLSSVTDVKVTKQDGGAGTAWSDCSSEFGSPTGSINGEMVELTLGAASGSNQIPTASRSPNHNYCVRVTVGTSNGETLVGTPTLEVTAVGDSDAP